ncbi:MAG TPA: ABC transporter substrate-binding protein [Acetobacteraceae bacterium]
MLPRRAALALALAAPASAWAQGTGPAAPIAALNEALLAVMRAGGSTPFASRVATFRPAAERALNLPVILQNSIGPRWASLSEANKAALLEAFTQWTVATWVANFDVYAGERFEILPDRRQVGRDEVVATRIVPRSGDPTRLDYVMRNAGGAWKAVDILLDGTISRVAVQRSDFRTLLTGGDPSALIANLRDKTASLAAGRK